LPWNIQEIISKISGLIVTSLVNSGSALKRSVASDNTHSEEAKTPINFT